MNDILGFLISIFTCFFDFLINFKIYQDISLLHLFFILSIFYLLLSFFIDKKGE